MRQLTYLVRHGEVHNPQGIVYADLDGYRLTDLGRAQAGETARRLPDRLTIVSSPLERAVETAAIIGDEAGATVEIDDALTEWQLASRWAGHVWTSVDDDFPGELTAYLDHPERLPFADEGLEDVADRVTGSVRRHRSTARGALVVVSHQDPIQAARLALTGRPLTGLQHDKPGHGAVITLRETDGGWLEEEVWSPAQGEVFPPIDS